MERQIQGTLHKGITVIATTQNDRRKMFEVLIKTINEILISFSKLNKLKTKHKTKGSFY